MSEYNIIDLFCGAGGFSEGFSRQAYNVLAGLDIHSGSLKTFENNHDSPSYNVDLSEISPDTLLNTIDVSEEELDGIVGGPPCLLEDEPILTNEGYVPIANIKRGDQVLTHKGNFERVKDLGSKKYSGELVKLNLKYRAEPLQLTPEHPVLTARGWVEAGDIKSSDSIAFPKQNETYTPTDFEYEITVNQHKTEYRTIETDYKPLRKLVGLYLAEGWRRSDRPVIKFAVHEDEEDESRKIIKTVVDRSVRKESGTEGDCVKLGVRHRGLWEFLKQFGRVSKEKRLPPHIERLDEKFAEPLLKQYVRGDGSEDDSRFRYTLASQELAESVQRLWYNTYGVLPSLRKNDNRKYKPSTINDREIQRGVNYASNITKTENYTLGEDDTHIYLPVYEIDSYKHDGYVYNLEVEEDNSYCTHLAAVHNCQGFSQAGNRDPDDDRNKLVMNYFDIIGEIEPKFFVMENVRAITYERNRHIIEYIENRIDELEYNYTYGVLNAANFGVPQTRKRLFIIGMKDESPTLPSRTHTEDEWVGVNDVIDVPDGQIVSSYGTQETLRGERNTRDTSQPSYTLRATRCLIDIIPNDYHPPEEGEELPSITDVRIYRFNEEDAALVQSFPEGYEFEGNLTSQRRQIGNAVPPKVAENIARKIQETLSN